MKAAFINQQGPPEVIQFDELPRPTPGARQCLVKVAAVDVNPIDTYIRGGLIAAPIPKPYIIGCDLAGTIETVGPDVTEFAAGQRVWCSNQGMAGRQGSFSEYAAVDADWLYPTPDGVSDEQAAAVSLVGITACLGLVRDAQVKPGDVLFVNGGTGGVGSCVVQIAKALGARVITTAGSDPKVAECLKLGADRAVNYKTQDVDAAIREFAPDGINVWWETLRDPDFERTVPLLSLRGRMILMAGRDARPIFPVGPFYVKDCRLFGFAMFNSPPAEQRRAAEQINTWMSAGKLVARIDRVLPLAQAADAHVLQEANTLHKAGTLAGKIVLRP
jgi:NADPH2:quinone reductase